ncbi:MAG: hypothetical protein WKF93_03600 [Acidimicrobiales bacterium]
MTATTGGPLDPRQAELLSALVDGELAGAERAEADALLVQSGAAQAEYAGLYRTKEALGSLPAVEPPAGFFEAMLAAGTPRADSLPVASPGIAAVPAAAAHPAPAPSWPATPAPAAPAWPALTAPGGGDELAARRDRRAARARGPIAAAVVGIAAASVVLGGVVGPDASVRPPLEDVAAAQGGSLPTGADEDFQTVRRADDLGDHPAPPAELADGSVLVETLAATSGEGILAVYEADGEVRTVYRQEGAVDWSALPEGVRATVEGDETWEDLTTDGFERVIVERGGAIYTLVGEVDADVLVGIGLELPEAEEQPDGLLERLRRAARGLVEVF